MSLNYRLFKSFDPNIRDRDNTIVKFSYVYRFGGQNNPVKRLFVSKTVSGVVFADLNANGKLDEGEEKIKGAKIVVSGKGAEEDDTTDDEGWYKVRGFESGPAVVSVQLPNEFKNYVVARSQSINIDGSTSFDIPVIKTKKVVVRVADYLTKELLDQELNVKCEDSSYSYPAVSRANLPARIYLPIGKICEIYPVFAESNSGGIQLVNSIKDDAKNFPEELKLEIKKENSIVVQAYLDKNRNSSYDFGEELGNLKIKIGKKTFTTDSTGEVFTPLKFGLNEIKVLSKRYKCKVRKSKIYVMKNEYQNFSTQIKCLKP